MTIASICSRDIVSVSRDAPLSRAAQLMREHHVGTVVVTDERDDGLHVVGIVTDRDLVIEAMARGIEGADLAVGALLGSGPLHSVPETADLGEAIAHMQSGGVRRLLVHDTEGHLVGVVSFDDVLRVVGAQLAGLATVLARGREREAETAGRLPEAPAAPSSPSSPPRPRLRVPAMGTAGWTLPGGIDR
jgi:CBS domain-containing protein